MKSKQERINALARSLKELHLATTVEEATERAKAIINSEAEGDKTIAELLAGQEGAHAQYVNRADARDHKEVKREAEQLEKKEGELKEKGEDLVEPLNDVHEDVVIDKHEHELEKGDYEEATRKTEELECAVKDTKHIIDMAEKVQKKKKE